jgi:hypothetical protein
MLECLVEWVIAGPGGLGSIKGSWLEHSVPFRVGRRKIGGKGSWTWLPYPLIRGVR